MPCISLEILLLHHLLSGRGRLVVWQLGLSLVISYLILEEGARSRLELAHLHLNLGHAHSIGHHEVLSLRLLKSETLVDSLKVDLGRDIGAQMSRLFFTGFFFFGLADIVFFVIFLFLSFEGWAHIVFFF